MTLTRPTSQGDSPPGSLSIQLLAPLPSLRSANFLYLLSLLLILTLGGWAQSRQLAWGLLGTEALLILLPTLLFIRLGRLNWRETLRWRWPGLRVTLLSLLIGAGMWPLSLLLESVSRSLFGYAPPAPSGLVPQSVSEAVLLFLALGVAAPLCEEAMFRGYIQRAYDQIDPRASILIVWWLFALFHQRFAGLLALLPIAFILSYLAYRSNSLIPGIIAHAAFNGLQVLISASGALRIDLSSAQVTRALGVLVFFGPLIAFLALQRLTKLARPAPPTPRERVPSRGWLLRWAWPLLLALLIFGYNARAEYLMGRAPERFAPPLELGALAQQPETRWKYDLLDRQGNKIGQANCALVPEGETFLFSYEMQHGAYDIQIAQSRYITGETERTLEARYRWQELQIAQLSVAERRADDQLTLQGSGERVLDLRKSWNGDTPTRHLLYPLDLLAGEWPWRLVALPFAAGYQGRATLNLFFTPGEIASRPALVRVLGQEELTLPGGAQSAWKVELSCGTAYGRHAELAWYAVASLHTLLRYDDGVVNWVWSGTP